MLPGSRYHRGGALAPGREPAEGCLREGARPSARLPPDSVKHTPSRAGGATSAPWIKDLGRWHVSGRSTRRLFLGSPRAGALSSIWRDEPLKILLIQEKGRARAAQTKVGVAASGFTQEGTSLQLQVDEIQAADFNAREVLRVGSAASRRQNDESLLDVRRGLNAKKRSTFDAVSQKITSLSKANARKRLK